MKFYIFVWSFFGGVFLASVFNLPLPVILFILLIFVSIFSALYLLKGNDSIFKTRSSRNYFYLGLIIILALLIGACRMALTKHHQNNPILAASLNKSVDINGIIVDEPDNRQNSTNLTLLPTKLFNKTIDKRSGEKILVRAPPNSNFQYGDEILASGKLELPQEIDSENGNSFNYPEYLAKDDIYYLINQVAASRISENHGNLIKRELFRIKDTFLGSLNNVLPEPHAGFMGGLIIAGKKSLSADLLAEFQKTGTLQIVVLSGYNITIVAEGMMKFFAFLPGAGGFVAGALGIVLFSIMAGATSTIVRACIMALISILGKATHRVYDARRALFMAGFLMVLQNPRILVYDSSFQLSFMATLGLMTLSPFFEKRLMWLPEKLGLRLTAAATLSAQVFVTPLILYQIGQVSLVSVPANMLMMVIIPQIMLFGFITGILGFLGRLIALPFSFISYFLLSYELLVLKFFSSIPFALLTIPFSFWFLFITYGFYLFIYFKTRKARWLVGESGGRIQPEAALTDLSEISDIKISED